mgnify:CR=1 FL=1
MIQFHQCQTLQMNNLNLYLDKIQIKDHLILCLPQLMKLVNQVVYLLNYLETLNNKNHNLKHNKQHKLLVINYKI